MKNIILLIVLFISCTSLKQTNLDHQIDIDYVPNEETAIKIAEAIWLPIFGQSIYEKKPFTAVLVDNKIWRVEGTLNTEIGGVPILELQKSDSKILKVSHSK